MRNNYLILGGLLLIFFSCVDHENDFEVQEITAAETKNSKGNELNVVGIVEEVTVPETTARQEIIIKYDASISEEEKEELRSNYAISEVKTCDCSAGNKRYELWLMEPHIQIEPTAKIIRNNNGSGGKDVEFAAPNYDFTTPLNSALTSDEGSWQEFYPGTSRSVHNLLNKVVASNVGVTVAVLDTGIDPSLSSFTQPFLYNSSQNGNCNEISGWNFVDGNNNPFDDDPYKHGSVVSFVIHDQLNQRGIPHQILPIKTADDQGSSDYFTTLCGLSYAIEIGAEVINLSFGWKTDDLHVYNLFSDLIDTTDAKIVCSAGNDDLDNDIHPHYPSSLHHDHVLAVAAAKANFNSAANYSNYGQTTVDFYAKGNKIYFPLRGTNNVVSHYGTSFATPFVSFRVAELLFNGVTDVRTNLIHEFGIKVNFNKPVQYMNLIK